MPKPGQGVIKTQLAVDHSTVLHSGGALFHGVTGAFDLSSASLPGVNKFARESLGEGGSGGVRTAPFTLLRPNDSYNNSFATTPVNYSRSGSPNSQLSMSVAHTPMTSALEEMDFVLVVSTAQPRPSAELISYFEGGGSNFSNVVRLLDGLLSRLFSGADPTVVSLPPQPPSPARTSAAVTPTSPAMPLSFLKENGEMSVLPNGGESHSYVRSPPQTMTQFLTQ